MKNVSDKKVSTKSLIFFLASALVNTLVAGKLILCKMVSRLPNLTVWILRTRDVHVWSVLPNGSVFVYELSGSGFESSCSHYRICLK